MLLRWFGRVLLSLLAVVLVVLVPTRRALADQGAAHTLSVAVLAFDSDDAEEHADGLTAALRSRVRASQGWSLVETSQSLGMITAALRCPGKPIPADCAQRISEQIRSDRYIFGYVQRGPQAGQVTAEVHLYQKGKPDTVHRESYADNLKDQNDDTLRKIAQKVLDRLGGSAVGVLLVRAGSDGEVVIDGDKRVPLQSGAARIELAPGSHSIEVASGSSSQKRNVLVTAGKETVFDLGSPSSSSSSSPEPTTPERPFPWRKVISGAAIVVGVTMGVIAVERFVKYNSLKDDFESNPKFAPDNFRKQGSVDACDAVLTNGQQSSSACEQSKDAKSASTTAIVMGVGSALFLAGGAVLFFTGDAASSGASDATKSAKTRLTPTVGYGSGGVMLSGRF